jgi:hypothetical protein
MHATGKHTVVLTEGRTYLIEVRYGTSSQCIPNLTLSVGDDRTADVIHRALHAALDDGLDVDAIRANVFDALVYEYTNMVGRPYRDAAYLADLDRAMGIFEPASTPERLAELGQHVAEMAGAR